MRRLLKIMNNLQPGNHRIGVATGEMYGTETIRATFQFVLPEREYDDSDVI